MSWEENKMKNNKDIRRILARLGKSCDNNKANYELQYNEDNSI